MTAVKTVYPLTSIAWPYHGLRYRLTELEYRKIPKISPSKYKSPKLVTQKSPPLNRPSWWGLCLEIALKYKKKTKKNGKFPSKKAATPIDFETQISLRT